MRVMRQVNTYFIYPQIPSIKFNTQNTLNTDFIDDGSAYQVICIIKLISMTVFFKRLHQSIVIRRCVIKDGDLLEVDGTSVIVKIIKE